MGDSVHCRNYENASCLKCGAVDKQMVRIGAFIMCQACWEAEFNMVLEIPCSSDDYKIKYHKWIERYKRWSEFGDTLEPKEMERK